MAKKPFMELPQRRSIGGAVWQNWNRQSGEPFYTVSLNRSRKDQNDQWVNETVYLSYDEIQNAIALLQQADSVITHQFERDGVLAAESPPSGEAEKARPAAGKTRRERQPAATSAERGF